MATAERTAAPATNVGMLASATGAPDAAAQRIVGSESVVCAELEGEAVLLNIETGVYFGLDEVATRIWSLIVGGATVDTVVAQLLTEYDVEPTRLRDDVSAFLAQLAAKDLTRTVAPGAQDALARGR